jgi:hypothetical protein
MTRIITIPDEERAAKHKLIHKIDSLVSYKINDLNKIREAWEDGIISNREYIMRTKIAVCEISNGCDQLI